MHTQPTHRPSPKKHLQSRQQNIGSDKQTWWNRWTSTASQMRTRMFNPGHWEKGGKGI